MTALKLDPSENKVSQFAPLFAALGDETRLALLVTLADRQAHSISQLTSGANISRQAVTKHLRVLEKVGLVDSTKSGRESHYQLQPGRFSDIKEYLDFVSAQWDSALARLKIFVED